MFVDLNQSLFGRLTKKLNQAVKLLYEVFREALKNVS